LPAKVDHAADIGGGLGNRGHLDIADDFADLEDHQAVLFVSQGEGQYLPSLSFLALLRSFVSVAISDIADLLNEPVVEAVVPGSHGPTCRADGAEGMYLWLGPRYPTTMRRFTREAPSDIGISWQGIEKDREQLEVVGTTISQPISEEFGSGRGNGERF
jgi:hypothetical protein